MTHEEFILQLANKARQQELTAIERGILKREGQVSELLTENKRLEAGWEAANKELIIWTKRAGSLANTLDQHYWIPVSERLPEEGGLYYTFARHTSMPVVTMFHSKDKKWNRRSQVTHWKPIILPEQALKA